MRKIQIGLLIIVLMLGVLATSLFACSDSASAATGRLANRVYDIDGNMLYSDKNTGFVYTAGGRPLADEHGSPIVFNGEFVDSDSIILNVKDDRSLTSKGGNTIAPLRGDKQVYLLCFSNTTGDPKTDATINNYYENGLDGWYPPWQLGRNYFTTRVETQAKLFGGGDYSVGVLMGAPIFDVRVDYYYDFYGQLLMKDFKNSSIALSNLKHVITVLDLNLTVIEYISKLEEAGVTPLRNEKATRKGVDLKDDRGNQVYIQNNMLVDFMGYPLLAGDAKPCFYEGYYPLGVGENYVDSKGNALYVNAQNQLVDGTGFVLRTVITNILLGEEVYFRFMKDGKTILPVKVTGNASDGYKFTDMDGNPINENDFLKVNIDLNDRKEYHPEEFENGWDNFMRTLSNIWNFIAEYWWLIILGIVVAAMIVVALVKLITTYGAEAIGYILCWTIFLPITLPVYFIRKKKSE